MTLLQKNKEKILKVIFNPTTIGLILRSEIKYHGQNKIKICFPIAREFARIYTVNPKKYYQLEDETLEIFYKYLD